MMKDDRVRFTLRIPRNLFTMIQDKANTTGVATNALILQILWNWAKDKEVADSYKEDGSSNKGQSLEHKID